MKWATSLAGWLSGFRPKQIKIGPLHLGRHARCGEPYCGDVITLGAAVLEPRVNDQDDATLRRRLLFLMLGGPLASILLAGALEIAVYVSQPDFVVAFGLHVGAVFSALIGHCRLFAGREPSRHVF